MRGLFKFNEKGQSMVEFALVLPILIALVVGIIQFGFIFNVKITLSNQARDTVRLIAVGSLDQNDVDETVRNSLKDNSLISKYTEGTKLSVVAKTESLANDEIQATVTITIPAYDLMVVSKPMSLSGSATMRVEPGIESDGSGENTPPNTASYEDNLKEFGRLYILLVDTLPHANHDDNGKIWWDNGGYHMVEAKKLYKQLYDVKPDFFKELSGTYVDKW